MNFIQTQKIEYLKIIKIEDKKNIKLIKEDSYSELRKNLNIQLDYQKIFGIKLILMSLIKSTR